MSWAVRIGNSLCQEIRREQPGQWAGGERVWEEGKPMGEMREATMAQKRVELVCISETKHLFMGNFSQLFSPPTFFSGYHVSCANQYFITVATEQWTPSHPPLPTPWMTNEGENECWGKVKKVEGGGQREAEPWRNVSQEMAKAKRGGRRSEWAKRLKPDK